MGRWLDDSEKKPIAGQSVESWVEALQIPNGLRKGRPMLRTSSNYMNRASEGKIRQSGHLKLRGRSMDGTNAAIDSAISCVSAGL